MAKKILRTTAFSLAVLLLLAVGTALRDGHTLEASLIRLHVKANSDSEEDQALKLMVKDEVVSKLADALADQENLQQAEAWLRENLQQVRAWAEAAVRAAGSNQGVRVSLDWEAFPKRVYDTFSLPTGIYKALRITLGQGEGHNWWCVVFPSLCQPATSEEFQEAAQAAGFSQTLTDTVTENGTEYELRFWLLDFLGKVKSAFQ